MEHKEENKLGFLFLLIPFYIYLDWARPTLLLSFRLTLVISILLFLSWLVYPNKKWNPQIVCFFLFLGLMALGVPFAANITPAFWTTYNMAVLLLSFCIPLIHHTNSLQRITILINTIMVVFLYVGLYAIFNNGFGPQGAAGAQDENYVSAAMAMAIPFAYFSLFLAKSLLRKLVLVGFLVVYVLAITVSFSRGGFLAMCAVVLYCLLKSPRKLAGYIVAALLVGTITLSTTTKYWSEMSTITDTSEGTANMRIDIWKIAIREYLDYPVFGVGPHNFAWNIEGRQTEEQFDKYGRSLAGSIVPHSLYFELLAELGTVGVVIFGAILYSNRKDMKYVLRGVNKLRRGLNRGDASEKLEKKDSILGMITRVEYYQFALTGSILACLAAGLFLSLLYFTFFWILTAMSIALKEVFVERTERRGMLGAPNQSVKPQIVSLYGHSQEIGQPCHRSIQYDDRFTRKEFTDLSGQMNH